MNKSRRSLMLGVATLAMAGVAGARAAAKPAASKTAGKVVKMEAKKFVYTPNRIVLKQGQPVTLEITAIDFTHGFNIPEWKIRSDLMAGQVTRIQLKPETVGEFDFLCDNFCGDGHEGMSGKIVVEA